jgi:hypothetical protein
MDHHHRQSEQMRLTVNTALFIDRKVLVAVMDKRVEQLADGDRRF